MRFTTILAAHAGAAIGFLAARRLLSRELDVERLPEAARGPLIAARAQLERGRARVSVAMSEASAERGEAERELRRAYAERTALRQ